MSSLVGNPWALVTERQDVLPPLPEITTPLFFLDVHDGKIIRDNGGQDVSNLKAVRKLAMETLARVAADEIPLDGDKQNFVFLVRDEQQRPIYSATLSFVGMWLHEQPID